MTVKIQLVGPHNEVTALTGEIAEYFDTRLHINEPSPSQTQYPDWVMHGTIGEESLVPARLSPKLLTDWPPRLDKIVYFAPGSHDSQRNREPLWYRILNPYPEEDDNEPNARYYTSILGDVQLVQHEEGQFSVGRYVFNSDAINPHHKERYEAFRSAVTGLALYLEAKYPRN